MPSSSSAEYTHQSMLHASIRFVSSVGMRSFDPVGPKPKERRHQEHLKGQNMRQLHTFIASWSAKKDKSTVHGKVCHIQPGGLAFPRKKKMREVEGRGSQGVKRKSEGQARGRSTAAGSSKRHFRLGGICGRPHYERMQVM